MSPLRVFSLIALIAFTLGLFGVVEAQRPEVITGNIISYGTRGYTGLRTGNFTLRIKSWTSDADAQRFLTTLQEAGQNRLLDTIRKQDVGSFSVNSNLARDVNVVRQRQSNGKILIRAVFERWTEFAEVRSGRRSLDYPFGYIELTVDPRTGKGTGQYFAAAKISWKKDKAGNYRVEIEDYATYPAKLVNVKIEGAM